MANIDDGLGSFGDGDDGRLIKGMKLKFTNDFTWVAGDDVIADDREFIVTGAVKALQKWIDQHPVETQVFPAHEKLPDIDALNAAAPPEEWTEKFGKKVGPWDWSYVVYMLDPKSMQIFTYVTNTTGGGQAVRALRESVCMAWRMHGDNVYPLVRLRDVFMKTQYGGRQRPHFDIISFETFGAPAALPESEQLKQIEAPKPDDKAEQKANKAAAATPKPKSKTRF